MKISNFEQLLQHELADLYSVESQLTNALPKMIASSSDEKLQSVLEEHLEVTENQLQRLEEISREFDFKKDMKCEGIAGIIAEGERMLKEIDNDSVKNVGIIAAAQKAEHYEISGYGSAVEFAKQLNFDSIANILEESLEEEKMADKNLSALATGGFFQSGLNEEAVEE